MRSDESGLFMCLFLEVGVLAGSRAGEYSENGLCDDHVFVCTNDAHLDMSRIG